MVNLGNFQNQLFKQALFSKIQNSMKCSKFYSSNIYVTNEVVSMAEKGSE